MTSPNPALLARLKASIFKNRGALGAGAAGVVTGVVAGVATGGSMSPTKPDENNQGNRSVTPPPVTPTTPTPSDIRSQIETPPLTGKGDTDYVKYIKEILPLVVSAGREQSDISLRSYLTALYANEQAALKKSEENTKRRNIDAWKEITIAQFNRDTALNLGLADIGFRATQANPGTLSSLVAASQVGVNAFK